MNAVETVISQTSMLLLATGDTEGYSSARAQALARVRLVLSNVRSDLRSKQEWRETLCKFCSMSQHNSCKICE